MGKKTNKIGGILAVVFLIGWLLVSLLRIHQFRKDYKFADGQVIEVTITGWKSSGDYSVKYKYKVNNKMYFNDQNYNYCGYLNMTAVRLLLKGKSFAVAYSVSDPRMSTMLITFKNAGRFHYIFSDSLKIYDSILTCK